MRQLLFFVLPVTIVFLSSCGEDAVDLQEPTLTIQEMTPAIGQGEVCGSLEEGVIALKGGEELLFTILFEDDVALSQYKIDIHNNFDCHGHGDGGAPGVVVPNVNNQTTDWTLLDIIDLSGTGQTIDRNLPVPTDVTAGNYHFQIQVIDAVGNDNPLANIYTLKVINPTDEIAPVIAASTPLGMGFSMAKGNSITFNGQVTDNHSLSVGGNGVLYLSYTDLSSGNTFNTDQVFIFDTSVNTVYDFSFEYMVPLTLKAGDYLFTLGATDGVRNVAESVVFNVEVTD